MKRIFDQINYKKLLNEKKYINTVLETKYNEPVLISYPADLSDFAVTIFLTSFIKGKYHRAHMYLIFKDNDMNISDIGVLKDEAKSRGYGDLLMFTALKIAKSKGASIITGNMVFESQEQRNRQINYYSKYGFQIDENYKLKLVL